MRTHLSAGKKTTSSSALLSAAWDAEGLVGSDRGTDRPGVRCELTDRYGSRSGGQRLTGAPAATLSRVPVYDPQETNQVFVAFQNKCQ